MEHTEVSQLFEISGGAKLLLRSKRNRNPFAYRIRSPDSVFDEKRKPNAEKRKIRKSRKTPQPKNRIFFFAAKTANPKNPKPPSLRLSQLWLFEEYSLSPWGLVFLSINSRGLFLCHFQFLCGSNTLPLSPYFYKRSPLQSNRRFYTWYIPERVLVFPCKMEMFLFLCFYSTLWRNLIEKISEPQFKRRLIFFFFKHLYFYCSRQIALKGLDLRRKWPQRLAKLQFSANLACKTKLSGFHILKF